MFLRKLFILAKRLFVGRSLKETISFFCISKQTNFLLIPKIISSRSFLVLFQKRRKLFYFQNFQVFTRCRFQNVPVRVQFYKFSVFKMCRQKMCRFRVNGRPIRHIFHRFQNVPASCERSLNHNCPFYSGLIFETDLDYEYGGYNKQSYYRKLQENKIIIVLQKVG